MTLPTTTTRPILRGAFTALVTPFTADGDLDEAAFRRLVRWQVLAGIDGLVPCGTTGESPTLTTDERERLIAATVEVVAERPSRDRVRVIAGHRHERHRGDDRGHAPGRRSSARTPPWSSRRTTTGPTAGCSRRTSAPIADEGDLPIVVYNVPSRTGTNVDADTFLRLAEHPRVIAVKEASGNLEQIAPDLPRPAARRRGPRRRRRLDPADPGDGRRRRRVGGVQRDPGRARRAVRGGPRRRLGRGPPDPRALAAAVPGQLPRRPEPGAGEGGARRDGPARDRRRPGAAPAARAGRGRRDGRHAPVARAGRAGRRPVRAARRRRGRRSHDRPRPRPRARPPPTRRSTRRRSSTTSRPAVSGPPSPTRRRPAAGGSGPTSRPRSSPASRTGRRSTSAAGPLLFRDRAAVPPRDDLAGGPWRIVPGGTAVRRGAHLARRRRRHAAVVRQRRRVGRRGDDGRLARPRRVVRPDRGARPSRGGRDHRWRPRAAGRAAGHRRGRRVRRRRQRAARGRPRRAGRGHRCRGDADRHVAAVRPRPRPGPRGDDRGAARRAGRCRRRARAHGPFAARSRRSTACPSRSALLVKDRDAGTSARVALEEALR